MKAIVLMFDSLNRRMLEPYAAEPMARTCNFRRLAERSTTFESSYVGSMPCMPARRDFHTGRPNFLHNGWGPLEPFDDSVPQMLDEAGVHTHLATDHYHYWEDGGATYHNRYRTYEFFRGQEGDRWHPRVGPVDAPASINGKGGRQDWINRNVQAEESAMPQTRTIRAGLDFLEENGREDGWMLQVECFDPHEPFVAAERFHRMFPRGDGRPDEVLFDWPGYQAVEESDEEVDQVRRRYAALLTQCDENLGRVMDAMDRLDLWDDTMLVVWTDHGYLLGEHGCWAKNWMPLYEEVARTPFFVWDPRRPDSAGGRRRSLVQPSLDLGPTLLRLFDLELTDPMLGRDLGGVIENDRAVRDTAMFGYFGDRVNVTDGRYVFFKAPVAAGPCHRYTLMPCATIGWQAEETLRRAALAEPFAFTRGMPLLKLPQPEPDRFEPQASLLFDLEQDPGQQRPIEAPEVRERLERRMVELMAAADAPAEQYERMGLPGP